MNAKIKNQKKIIDFVNGEEQPDIEPYLGVMPTKRKKNNHKRNIYFIEGD